MSSSPRTFIAPSGSVRSGRRGLTRYVSGALGVSIMLLAATRHAEAQTASRQPAIWESYLSGGWLIPTGAQRESLKGGDLTAVVVSYVPRPSFAITGTFEWARSHGQSLPGEPKLDVFICDFGAEARAPQMPLGSAGKVAPFLGIGGGARSYNVPRLPLDPTYNLAAYGSAGSEFVLRRVRLRLEVRDYFSNFKPLAGGGKSARRNDVVVMLGLRFTKDGA